METITILNQYVMSDIADIILKYAFNCTTRKTCTTEESFSLGYYEKCEEIVKKINKFKLPTIDKLYLKSRILFYSCLFVESDEDPNMTVINIAERIKTCNWLQKIFSQPVDIYYQGLCGAYQSGNEILIKYMDSKVTKGINFRYYDAIGYAITGGHFEIAKKLAKENPCKNSNVWREGIKAAYKIGNDDMIKLMSDHCFINDGIYGACMGKDIKNVKRAMVDAHRRLELVNWSSVFCAACESGNMEMVDFIMPAMSLLEIEKDLTITLRYILNGKNINIVKKIVKMIKSKDQKIYWKFHLEYLGTSTVEIVEFIMGEFEEINTFSKIFALRKLYSGGDKLYVPFSSILRQACKTASIEMIDYFINK